MFRDGAKTKPQAAMFELLNLTSFFETQVNEHYLGLKT